MISRDQAARAILASMEVATTALGRCYDEKRATPDESFILFFTYTRPGSFFFFSFFALLSRRNKAEWSRRAPVFMHSEG
jgi:hypothetical protein